MLASDSLVPLDPETGNSNLNRKACVELLARDAPVGAFIYMRTYYSCVGEQSLCSNYYGKNKRFVQKINYNGKRSFLAQAGLLGMSDYSLPKRDLIPSELLQHVRTHISRNSKQLESDAVD